MLDGSDIINPVSYNINMATTIRQKIAASKMVENGGNIGRAMIAAGYSPATAKTPQKLTTSKGWRELMDSLFPDELLLRKHGELLDAKKVIVHYSQGKREIIGVEMDAPIVLKAIDMAYKLKGRYKYKAASTQSFTGWTPEELEAYAVYAVVPERFKNEKI